MAEQLLKRWNDWSAGIGFPIDDGRTRGMYYSSGLLGLVGELRPAPVFTTVTTSIFSNTSTYNLSGDVEWHLGQMHLRREGTSTVTAVGTATDSKGNTATLTYAHTPPAGTDKILVVTVHNSGNVNPTGVTFDGDAMTKELNGTSTYRVSMWQLVDADAAGTDIATIGSGGNVVVTFAGAEDVVSSAQTYTGVNQSTPVVGGDEHTQANAGPAFNAELNGFPGMLVDALLYKSTTVTAIPDYLQTLILSTTTQNDFRALAGYRPITTGDQHFQYYFEADANADPLHPFLYAVQGRRNETDTGTFNKIDLSNADFGTFESGQHNLDYNPGGYPQPGQPAKYEGFWWIPEGNDHGIRKLSVVGTGDVTTDTFAARVQPFVPGADHIAILNDQLVSVVKEGSATLPGVAGRGTNAGGVRILKVGGDPATAGDWGAAFPVGELTERATALISLEGLTFVLKRDGLYSFNNRGRARLVFEDLRQWRSLHETVPMAAWRAGLFMVHPSGLLFFLPGELPVQVGLDSRTEARQSPPSGVTELAGGVYHDTSAIGDFVFGLYQSDLSTTDALVLCAYTETVNPFPLIWQSLGAVSLNDPDYMMGIHVATNGRPRSAKFVTPTLWTQNGNDLNYMVLSPRASPFRARADKHKVITSGEAWMSELVFTEPVDLSRLVAVASEDMITGDEWKISMVANGTTKEVALGYVKSKGRKTLKIDRHSVTRMSLRVQFTGTSTADRVPPVLKELSLFGDKAVGEAAES